MGFEWMCLYNQSMIRGRAKVIRTAQQANPFSSFLPSNKLTVPIAYKQEGTHSTLAAHGLFAAPTHARMHTHTRSLTEKKTPSFARTRTHEHRRVFRQINAMP